MSDLTVFASAMNELADTVHNNVVTLQKKVANEVVEFVSTATPVLTGQASGNWITSIGSPETSWNIGPSSAGVAISQAQSALSALRIGQTVYIANNVPYITKLNSGYSQQAPASFVELSALKALNTIGQFNLLVK